jgi:hypothetical protein
LFLTVSRKISGGVLHKDKIILWRIDRLLGNDSVNIFPREPTRAT